MNPLIVHLSANKSQNSQMEPARIKWDWTSAAILIFAVFLGSWRLVATDWTDHLLRVQFLAILATVFGLALGASRFSRWLVIPLGAAYGSFFIPWQLGLTIVDIAGWNERLESGWSRLTFAFGQWVGGENVNDPILFLGIAAFILWVISLSAGFILARLRNPWWATLPLGGVVVMMHTYDARVSSKVWYLAAYLLFALLLVARAHLLEQREAWGKNGTHTPYYIGQDMLRATLLAGAAMVILAWVTPALASSDNAIERAWDAITQPWREFRAEFGRAFYPLEGEAVSVSDYYGEVLSLGRGNVLADTIVLTAEIPDDNPPGVRYYWRDRIYDIYEDGSWHISFGKEERLREEDPAPLVPQQEGRSVGSVTITSGRSIYLLHSPPQPLGFNRTADVSFGANPDGTWDIVAMRAPVALRPGDTYEAEAYLTSATITQLREAGTDYPDWVKERYLQVPEEITSRTLELALELAEGQETPYDVAAAITNWLRENIEYQDTIELPPNDAEPVDWVLFELKQAFCNYYATAEIMMLRSLGIPARLAVGYAQGEEVELNLLLAGSETEKAELLGGIVEEVTYYTVRQRDVHAWPEVYFPGIGWVEFEPTGNQAPLIRPLGLEEALEEGDVASTANGADKPNESEVDTSMLEQRLLAERAAEAAAEAASLRLRTMSFLAVAIITTTSALLWRRYRQRGGSPVPVLIERSMKRLDVRPPRQLHVWADYAELDRLAQAYMEINTALRRLGVPPKAGETPEERATNLSARLPQLAAVIREVSSRYQQARYQMISSKEDLEGASRAKWAIRLASMSERLKKWFAHLQNVTRKLSHPSRKRARIT